MTPLPKNGQHYKSGDNPDTFLRNLLIILIVPALPVAIYCLGLVH